MRRTSAGSAVARVSKVRGVANFTVLSVRIARAAMDSFNTTDSTVRAMHKATAATAPGSECLPGAGARKGMAVSVPIAVARVAAASEGGVAEVAIDARLTMLALGEAVAR